MALSESNTGRWLGQATNRYITGNVEDGNYPKAALGTGAFVGSALFEGTDALIADIVGQDLEPLAPVPFARLRRDVPQFISDVLHFRLLSVAADVFRAPGSIVMDGVDLVGTFYDGEKHALQTRSHIQNLLTEESHAMAA
jgi:hypothetical protein